VTARRWVLRGLVALGVFGLLHVTFTWTRLGPQPLRLGLLVLLGVAVAGLVRDALEAGTGAPGWTAQPPRPMVPVGGDLRLAAYVRLVDGHLTAAGPDPALRNRLAALCDERLERRHGLDRADPAAHERLRELLGERLLDDLAGAPRRLRRDEIDDHLRRIEEL
jgi:hypothetical protein